MTAITITNAGHNVLRDSVSGANTALVKFVAMGTSSTAPAVTDTALGAESYRKAVTSYVVGATGEILVSMNLGPSDDLNDIIAEIGFFSGNATSAANSGVLLAHGLYSHTHVGTESITFTLDLTL